MKINDLREGINLDTKDNILIKIPPGDTESSPISFGGFACIRLLIPSNFTSATLSFYISLDKQSWFRTKYVDGNYLSIPCIANDDIFLTNFLIGVSGNVYFKIVSSVAQTEDVILTAICSPVYGNI